jgi:hypothetical protein
MDRVAAIAAGTDWSRLNIFLTNDSSCVHGNADLIMGVVSARNEYRWLAQCAQVLINEQEVNMTDDSSCRLPNERIFSIEIAPSGGSAETCSVTTFVH